MEAASSQDLFYVHNVPSLDDPTRIGRVAREHPNVAYYCYVCSLRHHSPTPSARDRVYLSYQINDSLYHICERLSPV
jgi:hypothetical protein